LSIILSNLCSNCKKACFYIDFYVSLCYNLRDKNIVNLVGQLQEDKTLEKLIKLSAEGASESETLRQKDKGNFI